MTLEEQLKIDEAVRHRPYKCSAGAWTVGVGWNISERGLPGAVLHQYLEYGEITDEQIDDLLEQSLVDATADANRFCGYLPPSNRVRWEAIINMAFNLGWDRLKGFKKMRRAVNDNDWDLAADEAKDSKWYGQVGERAKRIVEELRTGERA